MATSRHCFTIALMGLGAAVSACSALLGINDLTPPPPDEGDGGPTSTDASTTDAPFDATPSYAAPSGRCDGSLCNALPLTSSEVNIEELRVVRDRVLYRADNHVLTVSLNGGLSRVLVPCANRAGLALTDVGFYSWCNTTVTLRDAVDAAAPLATGTWDGAGAEVGDNWLVFGEGTGMLFRVPATLGDAGASQFDYRVPGFRSFTASTSDVFYMTLDGTLLHAAFGTGGGTALEQNQTAPSQIVADDAAVFWSTGSDTDHAVLYRRLFVGGVAKPLATGLDHPDGLAVDATHVYVTLRGTPPAYTNGAIVRVPRLGGGDAETLATGLVYPHQIVVTDRFVVWTSRGTGSDAGFSGGAIYRLDK
jgi:hypothetical protein